MNQIFLGNKCEVKIFKILKKLFYPIILKYFI